MAVVHSAAGARAQSFTFPVGDLKTRSMAAADTKTAGVAGARSPAAAVPGGVGAAAWWSFSASVRQAGHTVS